MNRMHIIRPSDCQVTAVTGVWKDVKETGAEYQKKARAKWRKKKQDFRNVKDLNLKKSY